MRDQQAQRAALQQDLRHFNTSGPFPNGQLPKAPLLTAAQQHQMLAQHRASQHAQQQAQLAASLRCPRRSQRASCLLHWCSSSATLAFAADCEAACAPAVPCTPPLVQLLAGLSTCQPRSEAVPGCCSLPSCKQAWSARSLEPGAPCSP